MVVTGSYDSVERIAICLGLFESVFFITMVSEQHHIYISMVLIRTISRISVNVCTHVCAHVHTQVYTHVYTPVWTHADRYAYTHPYTHAYIYPLDMGHTWLRVRPKKIFPISLFDAVSFVTVLFIGAL